MAEKLSEAHKDMIRHCDAYGRHGAIANRMWLEFREECKVAFTECLALGLVEGREVKERGDGVVRYFSTSAGRALLEGETDGT